MEAPRTETDRGNEASERVTGQAHFEVLLQRIAKARAAQDPDGVEAAEHELARLLRPPATDLPEDFKLKQANESERTE